MSDSRHDAASGSRTSAAQIPYASILRRGDRILFGQACCEPVGLVAGLLRQGEALHARCGKLGLFGAGSYSGLVKPEHAEWFTISSYGAIGDGAALAAVGKLNLYPVHYSQLPELLTSASGGHRTDVLLLQLSPPDANGRHSLGVANDFLPAVARQARVVIAEVNAQVPFVPSNLLPADVRIDHVVHRDVPLVELPQAAIDATAARIAAHVAGLIPDGATLQMGVGSVMEAICAALRDHRDLGIHGGVMIDGMAELMGCGAITNVRKTVHAGKTVAGSLLGSRRLFDFVRDNPDIVLAETTVTHGVASLAEVPALCAINSAVEVDLTGQVNAEVSRGRYIGALGGQGDYVRAARRSPGGCSIIALQSAAGRGTISRIIGALQGPATTSRSDVDFVVTEWGVADLRLRSMAERVEALIAIAHPDHREALRQSQG